MVKSLDQSRVRLISPFPTSPVAQNWTTFEVDPSGGFTCCAISSTASSAVTSFSALVREQKIQLDRKRSGVRQSDSDIA
jgi:hypothetical protein